MNIVETMNFNIVEHVTKQHCLANDLAIKLFQPCFIVRLTVALNSFTK